MESHGSTPFGHLLLARYEREACDAYFEIEYFIILEMIPSHVLSLLWFKHKAFADQLYTKKLANLN